MDRSIAENDRKGYKPRYKSGWALLAVAGVFLLNVILQAVQGQWGGMTTQFLIGLTLLVSSGWNLIAYRRHVEKELQSTGRVPEEPVESRSAFPRSSRVAAAFILASLYVLYTTEGVGWGFQFIFVMVAFISLIVIAANYMRAWQDRREKEFLEESAPSTGELDAPDTRDALPFSEPPSITEATTKTLDVVTTRIKKKKGPSGELVSPHS